MHWNHHAPRRFLLLILVLTALCGSVFAQSVTLDPEAVFCLSPAGFEAVDDNTQGIFISAVPASSVCELRLGQRLIRPGDVLPQQALSQLTVSAACDREAEGTLFYRTISEEGLGGSAQLKFSLLGKKNTPPVAQDSELETYQNIENSGKLSVSDEENDPLTYTLVKEPRRGTVELHKDGSFTYTPKENKVGRDSFVFTATDSAGNVSNEAKVRIRIVKPLDKATYSDLPKEQAHMAMWLKDQKVYAGRSIDSNLCFCPDETLTRGEFLVMAMGLFDAPAEDALLTSGFADEQQTPNWLRPYIVSAFKSGIISGSPTEDGMVFRPTENLTYAEAAVMLQGILDLPKADSQTVFALGEESDSVPDWARESVAAFRQAGLSFSSARSDQPISRLEAAELLTDAYQLCQEQGIRNFFWTE